MSPIAQHLTVLAAVALAGVYLLRALWQTLTHRSSGLGNCCAQGCTPPQAKPATHFISADAMLARAKYRQQR